MQKIVVGIIAVFFVQVGFQVYLAVDRTNAEFASVDVASAPKESSTARSPVLDDLYRTSVGTGETPTRRSAVTSPTENHRRTPSQRIVAVLPKPHPPKVVSSAAIGPDIVITIPSRPRPTYSWTKAIATPTLGREKKRSFLSKSVHVLKKPYDWLKAVAMNLD